MSLKGSHTSDTQQKTKTSTPSPDEIWKTLDRVGQRLDQVGQRLDQVGQRLDRVAQQQEEAERLSVQRAKEAEKRQEEAERLSVQRAKEAEKRQEEAERLSVQRAKEAEKWQQEAEKRQKEAERLSAQRAVEFKEEMKAHRKENERQLNKFRGIWSNAWGDFVESLVSGRFVELIQHWVPSITQICKNIASKRGQHECEVDIMAINSDSLVATEVKSTLNVNDVREFLETLKHFTLFFPQYKGYKVYGAVAYLKANQNAQKFAMRQGLFVICATGDSSQIINDKKSFIPQIIQQAKQFLSK